MHNIIQDILLTEFFDRKIGNTGVIGMKELFIMTQSFKNKKLDVTHFEKQASNYIISSSECYALETLINNKLPAFMNILHSCNGKLSVCGIHAIPLQYLRRSNCICLYFDSCSVDEAKEMLSMLFIYNINYVTYNNITWIQLIIGEYYIFISLIIYNNKNHLLRSIGSGPERHGWNPVTGYFTTYSGILSAITQTYIIEPNTSIRHLTFYNEEVGLNIAFPGLSQIKKGKDYIVTGEGMINFNDKIYISPNSGTVNSPFITSWNIARLIINGFMTQTPFNIMSLNLSYANEIKLISSRDWFPSYYKLYNIGINNDRYVAFANCGKSFNIPKEILSLVCYYWFEEENKLAQQRLLNSVCLKI